MSMPALVHICSFYWTNPVHERLFTELHAQTGLKQIVVVPLKTASLKAEARPVDFGRIVQLDCLNLLTSASSRHRGNKTVRAMRSHGIWNELAALTVVCVHAHSAYMDGFAARRVARFVGAPYCLTFRMTDTDFCFRHRPWATAFMRPLARGADALLAISHGDLGRVADRLGIEPGRMAWLGSGVDDECIARALAAKPRPADGALVFATTGKLGYAYKRVDLTVRACALAAARLGVADWRLRVLGMTHEEYARTHGRDVDEGPLRRHVEFLGRIESRTAVLELLAQASQFVLPSKETFGITFLEAVSQCTPIVWLRGYAVDGVFGEVWVGEAAQAQTVTHVADAIVAVARESGGALGPFDANPVRGLGWDALARRYRRLVLDDVRAVEGVVPPRT